LAQFADAALAGGVDIIQLRDKGSAGEQRFGPLEARDELAACEVLADAARRRGALFAVNDRADIARAAGADVLHLGQGDLPLAIAREIVGPDTLLGLSSHDSEQAAAAASGAADYFCVGPCWPTPTKPGRVAPGLQLVRAASQLVSALESDKPWFAIGGIDAQRLPDVLEVVYLIFNEGYAASSGERWVRTELCEEALRLGRILAALAPREPEAHGLIALLEIQASRTAARVDGEGEPVLLLDQDRSRWDPLLIVRGVAALKRAEELPAPLGPYGLQAAIAACHGRALKAEDTDWVRIAALYEALAALSPSPIVELNRAVAVGMAFGPEVGLALLERVAAEPALRGYHLVASVRGDLLAKLGRAEEAATEFRRAAELTENESERALLLRRAREVES